ncbi:MAG: phage protease [Anaerovoracaceae bacterium]
MKGIEKTYICRAEPKEIANAPEEIKILPLGVVHSQKGDFLVDEKSFQMIQKEFKERKLDKVVDYEHQTLKDVQAPAAGWIKELRMDTDAVVAKVEWNLKAQEYLKNKEYRYVSPVVRVRESDNRAAVLHSLALTNTPAIDGMFSINKFDEYDEMYEEDDEMELKEILKLLGLEEGADESAVRERIETLTGSIKELKDLKEKGERGAAPIVCKLLELSEDAKAEDVSAAILALKTSSEDTVSKAEYLALKERLDRQDCEKSVELALKEGKLTADMKDWALEYALKDSEGFKSFVSKAPQVVPMGQIVYADEKKNAAYESTTLKVCKDLGISEDDLKKYGKDEE